MQGDAEDKRRPRVNETEGSIKVFKALSDASRLRILRALLGTPSCVEELAARLNLAASTVSFHLKKLAAAGLVTRSREQYYQVFYPERRLLDVPLSCLIDGAPATETADLRRIARYRQKTIRTFFKRGRLVQMPTQKRKQRIVLAVFANDFQLDTPYDEPDVDRIIRKRFEDHCRIRRGLVDEGLMERNAGVYHRIRDTEPVQIPDLTEEADMTKQTSNDNRQTIKQAYKDAPIKAGIYCVRNIQTGRVLIGSSTNLHGPLNRHKWELKFGSHRCAKLLSDWRATGEENFAFEIVDVVKEKDEPGFNLEDALEAMENRWIEKLRPFEENCYNTNEKLRTLVY